MPKKATASAEQQLIAILVGMDSAETAAVIGLETGRLWTLQQQEGGMGINYLLEKKFNGEIKIIIFFC